jgi:hypothetical protein
VRDAAPSTRPLPRSTTRSCSTTLIGYLKLGRRTWVDSAPMVRLRQRERPDGDDRGEQPERSKPLFHQSSWRIVFG